MNNGLTTNEELRTKYIKILENYFSSLNPYDYEIPIFQDIANEYVLTKQKIDTITTNIETEYQKQFDIYLQEFVDFVRKEKSFKSDTLTSKQIFLKNISNIASEIYKTSGIIWSYIRFLFAIPAIAFSSFVLAYIINLFVPQAWNEEIDGLIISSIACIIYLIIRISIYKDVYLNDMKTNFKVYILKHISAIFLWWGLFLIIKDNTFKTVIDMNPFQQALFLPYLPICALKHEFFYMGILTYFLMNFICIIYIIIFVKMMEKRFDKMDIENKKYNMTDEEIRNFYFHNSAKNKNKIEIQNKKIVKDDSLEYHFDVNKDNSLENFNYLTKKKIRELNEKKKEKLKEK